MQNLENSFVLSTTAFKPHRYQQMSSQLSVYHKLKQFFFFKFLRFVHFYVLLEPRQTAKNRVA